MKLHISKLLSLTIVIVLTRPVFAEVEYLWPDGKMPDAQAHQIAAMTDETKKSDFDADSWRRPYIDWANAPEKPNGVCMIMISGGSYKNCCDVGLIKEWREKFTSLGCQCVNLVYRTPWPENLPIFMSAWQDGQRAVRIVRSQAQKRGFDPEKIGVVSMSAGSHLSTLLATSSLTRSYEEVDELDKQSCNVNWVLAFAPAFVLTDGYGKPNTRMGWAQDVALDECFKFDEATCPMCLMHGGADKYSTIGSLRIYRKLRQMKIPAELHIAPGKGHGAYGLDRGIEFMRQMGFLGKPAKEEDLLERYPSDETRAIHEQYDIWPVGKIPDAQEKQNIPYIEWHIPSNLTTKAIQIVWSGGAYNNSDPNRYEVAPIRRYLNERGVAVVTLRYRHPRPAKPLAKYTSAWQDAQRTIRIVRHEAKARGLDPNNIGIMGSSAGGHLALLCATSSKTNSYWPIDDIDKEDCSVQWAIVIYPAYASMDGLDAPNLHGGNDRDNRPAPEFVFDPSTPPMLFIHGDGDGWSAMNSVLAWEQLRRMGIQSELHTLAKRGHCFQRKASPGTGSYNWMDRIWEFLRPRIIAPN